MFGLGLNACVIGVVVSMAWVGVSEAEKKMNEKWQVVNDGVMGGLSQSVAAPMEDGALLFTGVVSFENNGGFASIRRSAEYLALENSGGIRLRIKGDGKNYQFRVRTSRRFDGIAYKHDFKTTQGGWQEIELKWSDFTPTFRGRRIPNAAALKASAIEQIGILIADKQEGAFKLLVDRIDPAQ